MSLARFVAKPNRTTNFLPYDTDNWYLKELPFIASTAIEQGSFIYAVGDGTHSKVTNATGNSIGILAEDIATTDADYATSAKLKHVWIPKTQDAECYFAVGSGTFTQGDEGANVKFNDEKSVAVDTAGTQFTITKYISSTRGVGKANLVKS